MVGIVAEAEDLEIAVLRFLPIDLDLERVLLGGLGFRTVCFSIGTDIIVDILSVIGSWSDIGSS